MTTERYMKKEGLLFISHNMNRPPRILSILIRDLRRRSGFRHRSLTFFTRCPLYVVAPVVLVSECSGRRGVRGRHAEVRHCTLLFLLSLSLSNAAVLGRRERAIRGRPLRTLDIVVVLIVSIVSLSLSIDTERRPETKAAFWASYYVSLSRRRRRRRLLEPSLFRL